MPPGARRRCNSVAIGSGATKWPTDDALGDEVAQDANQVGVRGVGPIDRLAQFLAAVERRPDVQISKDGDS